MKRWLIALALITVLLIAAIYLLIPGTIHIEERMVIRSSTNTLKRILFRPGANWNRWWPGDTSGHIYQYNNSSFTVSDITFNSIIIATGKKGVFTTTSLNLVPGTMDSTELVWEATIPVSANPFKRLQDYKQAQHFGDDLHTILAAINIYFSNPELVYGFNISRSSIKDSVLVSTFANTKNYPSTDFIYHLIDELREYIALHSGKETGIPMLNINAADSQTYLVRVAIPVNKQLQSSGKISYKLMPAGTPALIIDVKGGPILVEKAFHELENYINDHKRVAPAIPFLSLITDRSKETDTSKWVTRIYYPVM